MNVSPTMAEFEAMEQADPNAWWRLECGDHQNLYDEAREELARLRAMLSDILDCFTEKGHPGEPCLRTGWQRIQQVAQWRDVLARSQQQALEGCDRNGAPHSGRAGQ